MDTESFVNCLMGETFGDISLKILQCHSRTLRSDILRKDFCCHRTYGLLNARFSLSLRFIVIRNLPVDRSRTQHTTADLQYQTRY